jgi:hypothetical protein
MSEPTEYNIPVQGANIASVTRTFFVDLNDTLTEKGYLEMRERVLTTELNWVRRKLGKQPKTCPKCGEPL